MLREYLLDCLLGMFKYLISHSIWFLALKYYEYITLCVCGTVAIVLQWNGLQTIGGIILCSAFTKNSCKNKILNYCMKIFQF